MEWIEDFLKPEFIWALVGLILLLMEFAVPGLIIFFFGIGAWIVAAVCLFADISVNWQIGIFLVSSIVLLVTLRRLIKGVFVGHTYSKQNATENLTDYLGHKVLVTETITPPQTGSVELNGVKWNASAESTVETGQMVEIVGQESLTLIVKPLG
ncbi:MAG: NfeD family protein [Planctomycetota bacterium]|jgi:membrane protein implicated in regulation of membrane protease activity